jgi:hypothetical protein
MRVGLVGVQNHHVAVIRNSALANSRVALWTIWGFVPAGIDSMMLKA